MRFDKLSRYKPLILRDVKNATSDDPLKMDRLAKRYSINSRVVRDAINELRSVDCQPICGDNKGYYWPRYKTEWERTTLRLKSMAKKILDAGKYPGTIATSKEKLNSYVSMGLKYLVYLVDCEMIRSKYQNIVNEFKRITVE